MEVPMVSPVPRNPARCRMVAGLVLGLASLAIALSTVSSATAARPPGVKVLGKGNTVFAVFRSARCAVSARSPVLAFRAVAKSQGWTLDVTFWKGEGVRVSGSHMYPVEYGPAAPIEVSAEAPDRRFYSTAYEPPNPPRSAGGVRLGPRGAILSVGLYDVLGPDLQSGVAIAGGLTCHYPRRGRRP